MPEHRPDLAAAICANPDCRVAETRRCIEGFELSSCPNYGREVQRTSESLQESAGKTTSLASIPLPAADSLDLDGTSVLLRRGTARVIAIIGPGDSGKTSLIACLFDLLQESPISGINYARSETLHAFEQACHDARAASRRSKPHTYRTPRGKVRFYHLDLSGGGAGKKLGLVMGDRAGEEYQSVADNAAQAESFPEVTRADSVTVLVDGRRLVDTGERHNLSSEIVMMLQGLKDGGAFRIEQRLALVLTKLDLVQQSPRRERAEADFARLMSKIQRLFGDTFSAIEHFEIAASPESNTVSRGVGVPALLASWLEAVPRMQHVPPARPQFARAFARVVPQGARSDDGG